MNVQDGAAARAPGELWFGILEFFSSVVVCKNGFSRIRTVDASSQKGTATRLRYLPSKIEVGHDKRTDTRILFAHASWLGMFGATWMFVILHDNRRLHANGLRDNSEGSVAATAVAV